MFGRVHEYEVWGLVVRRAVAALGLLLLPVFPIDGHWVREPEALPVGKELRVSRDELDIGVPGNGPERLEAGALIPVDGGFPTEQVPLSPGVATSDI
jgi:hypothetical protein